MEESCPLCAAHCPDIVYAVVLSVKGSREIAVVLFERTLAVVYVASEKYLVSGFPVPIVFGPLVQILLGIQVIVFEVVAVEVGEN